MKLPTTILILLFGLILTLINQPACAAQTVSLEINTQEECQALDGVWNTCPPNECQRSEAFQKGKVLCAEVCDPPECEGIVPEEAQNLSEIHNPTIYQVKVNENNPDENQAELKDAIRPEPLDTKQTTTNKTYLILYLTLGLLLLFVFILIKNKQKNESSKAV
ncbi:MAG: hypothetical protein AAB525_00875 [Patescibacteria group bacterium]